MHNLYNTYVTHKDMSEALEMLSKQLNGDNNYNNNMQANIALQCDDNCIRCTFAAPQPMHNREYLFTPNETLNYACTVINTILADLGNILTPECLANIYLQTGEILCKDNESLFNEYYDRYPKYPAHIILPQGLQYAMEGIIKGRATEGNVMEENAMDVDCLPTRQPSHNFTQQTQGYESMFTESEPSRKRPGCSYRLQEERETKIQRLQGDDCNWQI